ncbi:SDR family NAD(P)-dependent oxidoreductase [Pseudobacter ginsenosidimutans]|uniref:NAD(P)-dependent dehydrogenase (Short-subunit alcohol dehydrogenase family) n=1 Tax=Pseudobacter ginsenosidimutans TaxID=661488 RepID=A0A4Q7N2K6_9BACT|nr:SDR family NAD(P)-dependent oxidoreductase [Pseudobacter ginsenosidimutans]QEC43673.1 SDR family NAD(P)-dependent oxidoreductase [Pseudobacter ginsenosidimutans]RZS75074.1 NAD(P)-dependent dehydrogenase (short-subunit alcohol dehydrogenase family) [Pseudobacter ginsenosidimutans]
MSYTFNNKAALITGANRGLGLELSRQLNKKGYFVFMGVRDLEKGKIALQTLTNPDYASLLLLDVSDPASVGSAVKQLDQTGYPLQILVNNAGVMMDGDVMKDSTTEIGPEQLRKTFDTNFFGLVELTNQVLPSLLQTPDARILNISSDMGSLQLHARQHPLARTFAYNASKAALNMYTIHLANALRDKNVKVNAVHPGWVKTDMGSEYAPLEIPDAVTAIVDFLLKDDLPTGKFVFRGEEIEW